MSPKKLVKASGMTTVKSSASRSRRVSRRSFEASVQTRFTRASRVALPEAQDGDREERDREPQRDEQVEHDVGESAAAHDGVPALQQPAVGGELLDAGVGASGGRGAGEVAAEQGQHQVDAGADGPRLRRRAHQRDHEQCEAGGDRRGHQGERRDGVEPAPVDAEDEAAGDQQDHGLHGHGHEDAAELAAEDGLPRRRRGEQPRQTILSGKFSSVFVTVTAQAVILLVAGRFIFSIDWGRLDAVAALTLVAAAVASGLALLVISLVRTPAQAGAIGAGVYLVLALLGGNFTGTAAAGGTYAGIQKLTPNGWLLQGWDAVMRGGGLADIVLNLLVPLGFAVAFFAVAVLRFRKRYA